MNEIFEMQPKQDYRIYYLCNDTSPYVKSPEQGLHIQNEKMQTCALTLCVKCCAHNLRTLFFDCIQPQTHFNKNKTP